MRGRNASTAWTGAGPGNDVKSGIVRLKAGEGHRATREVAQAVGAENVGRGDADLLAGDGAHLDACIALFDVLVDVIVGEACE